MQNTSRQIKDALRDAEVASSNLVASTKNRVPKGARFFVDIIIIELATFVGANASFGRRGPTASGGRRVWADRAGAKRPARPQVQIDFPVSHLRLLTE